MRLPTFRLGLLLASLAVAASAGCSRPPGLFSEPNARAHIGMLAGTIGSRPIGTPANARARDYIIDQLRLFGFDVRVQEADARRAALGRTARVANIIAVRPGRRSEAIGSSRTTTRCRRDRARPTTRSASACRSRRRACWPRAPIATGR